MNRAHQYLSGTIPRAFAHRGWHVGDLDGMENSLAAFRRASLEGIRYIETDVRASSDGVLVVQHDPTLDRTTDRGGSVSSLPHSEIKRARIGGREPVSTLEDALEELPEAYFNVDVKADDAVGPFLRVLERTGAIDRVGVTSFSSRRLVRLRKGGGPKLATALSPAAIQAVWSESRLMRSRIGHFATGLMAQVPTRWRSLRLCDERFVRAVHGIGAEVHVWTINELARMRELLDLGVDGVVTDRPDLLRSVLMERGAWPPQ